MKKLALFSFILLTMTLSCNKTQDELLVGKWEEVETGSAQLEFNADHSYSFQYDNGRFSQGKWRIKDNILFTTEKGSDVELQEEIAILDEENLVSVVGEVFQTKYKRVQ